MILIDYNIVTLLILNQREISMNHKHRKLIFYLTTGIMGLGMATFSFSNQADETLPAAHNLSSITPEQLNEITPAITPSIFVTLPITPAPTKSESLNSLLYNAYPEINELVTAFLNAKLDSTSTFENIVLNSSMIDFENIQRKTEYIKAYHNIKCYTKKGINEIDYIVYTVFDSELPTIDTYAPSIEELYIQYDSNNQPFIYFGDISEATAEYITQMRSSKDVAELIAKVNSQFNEALASDSALKEFFDNMIAAFSDEEK